MSCKELPKLPHGQGSFSWYRDKVRYQKTIKILGKQIRITVYGDSAKECLTLMSEKELAETNRIKKISKHSLQDETVTLADAMYDWLRLSLGKIKNNSYDRIECTIKNQIACYEIGQTRVIDITSNDIENHLKSLSSFSFSTIKKTYEVLNRFMKFYFSKDISTNPMNSIERPKPAKNVGEISIEQTLYSDKLEDLVLSDDEITTFGEYCLREPRNGIQGGSKYNPALYLILLTFLRIGEAVTLVWGDVDYNKKVLKINKSTARIVNRNEKGNRRTVNIITEPKTKSSVRQVALTDEALRVLDVIKTRSLYSGQRDFVICTSKGTQVSEQHLLAALKSTLKACGLNKNSERDKFGLHYLRHSGISYYLRHGVPIDVISEMAGHASTAITSEVYYHVISNQREKAAELMNSIVRV